MQPPDLHPLAAVLVGVLVLFGATFTLIGTVGLLRLKTFYDRIHPPTLGLSMGAASLVLATIIAFAGKAAGPVINVVLVLVLVTLTTPVTMMLLARAALFRDRSKAFDKELAAEVVAAAQRQADELKAAQDEAARHPEQPASEPLEDGLPNGPQAVRDTDDRQAPGDADEAASERE